MNHDNSTPDIIPIDEHLKSFANCLNRNDRVIFSAKFGDGKSFFLQQFREQYNNEYHFITIYPVNYQIEDNKDIFELIKREIIFQLCRNDLVTDQIDFNCIVKSTFNKETISELIGFLGNIASLALPGERIVTSVIQKFIQAKDDYDKNKKTIGSFQDKFQQTPGIYEFDCYSRLIAETITELNIVKKTVLIIEDLDRMDPAHVFRIMNIFSAHIDREYTCPLETNITMDCNNKFCFSKIITVCHYENLEKIYHHIYGPDTDFEGYIHKFSSCLPFNYSFKDPSITYFSDEMKKKYDIDFKELLDIKFSTSSTLRTKLREKSTRLLISYLENIEKIPDKLIDVLDDKKIHSKNSLTILLYLFEQLHIEYHDKDYYFNFILKKDINLFIKLIGTNWCMCKAYNKEALILRSKNFSSNIVRFEVTYNNNLIEKILILSIKYNSTDYDIIYTEIKPIIDSLKQYI